MKRVKEKLYEKFSEEGDPIEDLGIGKNVLKEKIFHIIKDIYLSDSQNLIELIRFYSNENNILFFLFEFNDKIFTETDNKYAKKYIQSLLEKTLSPTLFSKIIQYKKDKVQLYINKKYNKYFEFRYAGMYTSDWPNVRNYMDNYEKYMLLENSF